MQDTFTTRYRSITVIDFLFMDIPMSLFNKCIDVLTFVLFTKYMCVITIIKIFTLICKANIVSATIKLYQTKRH